MKILRLYVFLLPFGLLLARVIHVQVHAPSNCRDLDDKLPMQTMFVSRPPIHLTAKDENKLRATYDFAQLRKMFPDSTVRIWSDAEMHDEQLKHYPELTTLLEHIEPKICHIDILRTVVLHRYGGVFLDEDIQIKHAFYPRLPPFRVAMVETQARTMGKGIHHSIISSPAGHPFWNYTWSTVQRIVQERGGYIRDQGDPYYDVFPVTSYPMLLRAEAQMIRDRNESVVRLPWENFDVVPVTWKHPLQVLDSVLQLWRHHPVKNDNACTFTVHVAQGTYFPIKFLVLEYIVFTAFILYSLVCMYLLWKLSKLRAKVKPVRHRGEQEY